jgi:hypothetical protein
MENHVIFDPRPRLDNSQRGVKKRLKRIYDGAGLGCFRKNSGAPIRKRDGFDFLEKLIIVASNLKEGLNS